MYYNIQYNVVYIVDDCLGCEVWLHFIFVTIERSLRLTIFMLIFIISHSEKKMFVSRGKNIPLMQLLL